MINHFESQLTGGHPNSLGNTLAVVNQVIENKSLFDDLFNCYFSQDEVVRLRVSNAMKRICMADKSVLVPYIDRFLNEIARIDQASTQWTLARLFLLLESDMTKSQLTHAKAIVKHNLVNHNDWIVLNESMKTMTHWTHSDSALKSWLIPVLQKLNQDKRKSVSKTAQKMLDKLI